MLKSAETSIGLDVGGTRIRAARITRDGQMHGRTIEPVSSDRQGFVAQVLSLVEAVRDDTSSAIGIGIPGRVAGTTGTIHSAGYLEIAGLDLSQIITDATGLACHIENDATMALIAEARDTSGLIAMITVGTGVGGALVSDGQPVRGGDFAGQFGHIVVANEGPLCNCGKRGCVETLCAGPALGTLITQARFPKGLSAQEILDRAESGDATAREVVTEWAAPMQSAIQSLVAVVDPVRIILGGGLGIDMARALTHLADAGDWFNRPVTPARLGDDAGVIGAGLAGHMLRRPQ